MGPACCTLQPEPRCNMQPTDPVRSFPIHSRPDLVVALDGRFRVPHNDVLRES